MHIGNHATMMKDPMIGNHDQMMIPLMIPLMIPQPMSNGLLPKAIGRC